MEETEGYDLINTMFTPEGRLRQVEYAAKTTKRGSPVLAVIYKDGIIVLDHRRVFTDLRVARLQQKIEAVDDHIVVGISGIISDASVVIESAQIEAANHRLTYDTPIGVKSVTMEIGEIFQSHTQFSGLRPFGVSLIVAGIDENGPCLFMIEPSGIFYGYHAMCIGEDEEEVKGLLRKESWREMEFDDALRKVVDIFKRVLKKKFKQDLMQGRFMKTGGRAFEEINPRELKKAAKSTGRKPKKE